MTAKTLRVLAPALLIALLVAGPAAAEFTAPNVGFVSDSEIEAARRAVREAPLESHEQFERQDMDDRNLVFAPDPRAPGNGDNDATHYARGNTLVLHFFINHSGGTWSESERNAAAAKAAIAKDFYRDNAPAGANLEFDNGSNNLYAYYITNYGGNIPEDSMTWGLSELACQLIGIADSDGDGAYVDDLTYNLMDWSGGWDNVLCVFQPADIEGRAFASYGYARCVQYVDDLGSVWAHEWGHIFGSCDEYVEGGECNGGIDCGACQSFYLDQTYNNTNCQLNFCPQDVGCIMINNTLSGAICSATIGHWAWRDADSNGWMDSTRRRLSGSSKVPIYHVPSGGWWLSGGVEDQRGYALHQPNRSWGVVGLRSPGSADYDLRLYRDNNHHHQVASSSFAGQTIDFVVGDYNHNNLGIENWEVRRWSGDTASYRTQFESGNGILYPDGVARAFSIASTDVVRMWEVPLLAGETITFSLGVTSGSGNLGMSLFRSNGAEYFAGRSNAVWTRDAGGAGAGESWSYTVPADDVYGFVVFNNSAASGSYTIQIGPTPVTLTEDVSFNSGLALRLYNYDPISSYWAIIGTRPGDGTTDTEIGLYSASTYQTLLDETNYGAGATDFIAVDYNHVSSSFDYLRVWRESGTGTHRTEWEQKAETISGIVPSYSFGSLDVVKVWDAFMTNGLSYAVRSYQGGFDDELYLFDSSDGDYYQDRGELDDFSSGSYTSGEWMEYTADASDWHGLVQVSFDGGDGSSQLWFGRDISMPDETAATYTEEVLWGESTTTQPNWAIWGVRPTGSDQGRISLYGDEACTISTLRASDQSGSGEVNYVVGDYNHTPLETVYPRVWRGAGASPMRVEMEQSTETILYFGGAAGSTTWVWTTDDVVEIFDVLLSAGTPTRIQVEPVEGTSLDFGVALFQSSGATYYGDPGDAIASADAQGAGGVEVIDVTPSASDWYGLAIVSQNPGGGNYRITVGPQGAVSADLPGAATELAFAAFPNPSRDATTFRLSLPREDEVTVDVFDISGRLVSQVQAGSLPSGHHAIRWDGRDSAGRDVTAGVYFVRMRTSTSEEIRKITRLN